MLCQPEQVHYGTESAHLLPGYCCCGSSVQILGVKQSRKPRNKSPYVQSRLLRVPWTARRSNQSNLKEISPEYSLEGLMLKLKLQYFGHLMQRADSFEKSLMLGKIEGRRWGWWRRRWLDGITNTMDMGLGELWELVIDRRAAGHGVAKSRTWLSNWTELNIIIFLILVLLRGRLGYKAMHN